MSILNKIVYISFIILIIDNVFIKLHCYFAIYNYYIVFYMKVFFSDVNEALQITLGPFCPKLFTAQNIRCHSINIYPIHHNFSAVLSICANH